MAKMIRASHRIFGIPPIKLDITADRPPQMKDKLQNWRKWAQQTSVGSDCAQKEFLSGGFFCGLVREACKTNFR